MNLKLRLKNKATLTSLIMAAVAFIYQILGILNVVVPISQNDVVQVLGILINLLGVMGILVDPTTPGVGDSVNAMSYEELGQPIDPDYQGPADLKEEAIDITHKEEV